MSNVVTLPQRDKLLTLVQVQAIAGLGKSMLYILMRENKFPRGVKIGGRMVRWSEAEVYAWVHQIVTSGPRATLSDDEDADQDGAV